MSTFKINNDSNLSQQTPDQIIAKIKKDNDIDDDATLVTAPTSNTDTQPKSVRPRQSRGRTLYVKKEVQKPELIKEEVPEKNASETLTDKKKRIDEAHELKLYQQTLSSEKNEKMKKHIEEFEVKKHFDQVKAEYLKTVSFREEEIEVDREYFKKEYSREKAEEFDLVENYDDWEVPGKLFVPITNFSMKKFMTGGGALLSCLSLNWNPSTKYLPMPMMSNPMEFFGSRLKYWTRQFVATGVARHVWNWVKTPFVFINRIFERDSLVPVYIKPKTYIEIGVEKSTELIEQVDDFADPKIMGIIPSRWFNFISWVWQTDPELDRQLSCVKATWWSVPINVYALARLGFYAVLCFGLYKLYTCLPRNFTITFKRPSNACIKRDLRTDDLSLMNIKHNNLKLVKCNQVVNFAMLLDKFFTVDDEGNRKYLISFELLTQIAGPSNSNILADHEEIVKKMCHQATRMNSINFDRYSHLMTMLYPNTQWVAKCWHWNYLKVVRPVIPGF